MKNNIPSSKQEQLKNNYNLLKKAQNLQKTNLKFGKTIEHVNIESQKSKEKTEKYRNLLGVLKKKR